MKRWGCPEKSPPGLGLELGVVTLTLVTLTLTPGGTFPGGGDVSYNPQWGMLWYPDYLKDQI